MGISVQILRNILSNWGSIIIGVVVQFMMTPFLVHRLGDTQYGIWILIMNFTGFLGLFDFGLSGSVVKYVAEFKAKKDVEALNSVCSSSFFMYVTMGFAALIASVVIAFGFLPSFKIPLEEISSARWVTVIIGLQVFMSFLSVFFTGFMRGMQRYDHVAAISLTLFIIRSIIIVALVLMGYRLITLAIVQLASTTVGGAVRSLYVFRKNPQLHLSPSLISREKLFMVVNYSFLLFLYYIAQRFIFLAGSLIIGYYLAAAVIVFYSIPQRLVDELRTIVLATGVFQPTISHLNAKGQNMMIQSVLLRGTKYSLMVVLPVAVAYIIVGDAFISLWMGPKYSAECYWVLVILTCAIVAHISQFTSIQILQGISRHGGTAYITVMEGAANLALSLLLVKHYGIIGVAMGTLIPMLFFNIIVIPWYTCRVTGCSPTRYIGEGMLLPSVPAVVFGLILHFASGAVRISTWMEFILVLTPSLCTYVVCAWYLCLSKTERVNRLKDLTAVVSTLWLRVEKTVP